MSERFLRSVTRPALSVCMIAGALMGGWLCFRTLDLHFFMGTGGKWVQPDNDSAGYVIAWHYFLHDSWRFPLFAIPRMGYPEGGNVLFIDALPLTALVTKCVYTLTGMRINPFGPWNLLTYLLQGAFAARVLYAIGVRSLPAAVAGSVLAVCTTGFLWRMQHTAVSSHFLILWALALYFESVRGRKKIAEMCALAALTVLINSYLFVMVMCLQVVTVLALTTRRQLERRDLLVLLAGFAVVVAIALVSGYGIMLRNPSSMQAMGYGLFSWNLLTLVVPRSVPMIRDATGGQYEGEAYIGMGALLVLAIAIATRPATVARHIRDHAWLVCLLMLFAVYAAANRVYAGSTLVLSYDLPTRVEALTGFFRATGRFIWPVAYAVILLSLACVFRSARPAIAITVAAAAVALQLNEFGSFMRYFRMTTGRAQSETIDFVQVSEWVRTHDRIWQYPSWSCGGLVGPARQWGGLDSNRELQLQLLAAYAGRPTNSVYTSRTLKNCNQEFEWGARPHFEEGVLYLLSWKQAVEPPLATLVASGPCVGLSWGVVCSTRFKPGVDRVDVAR